MIAAVLHFLYQNEAEWAGFEPMLLATNELNAAKEQIAVLQQTSNTTHSGLVSSKDLRIENLINKVFELTSMLFLLAKKNNDEDLKAKVRFSLSDLKNLRDPELAVVAAGILALGLENAGNLETYGITGDKLTELDTLVTEYQQGLPAYRSSISQRKAANSELKIQITKALTIVKEDMDRLMVKYRISNPKFYAGYLNARKVIEYGTRHDKKEDDTKPNPEA